MASRASKIHFLILLCIALASYCNVALAAGESGGVIFNVMKFGAKPGKQVSTQAFVKAWRAACDFNGLGRVFVPAGDYTIGEAIFQGPCVNRNPVFTLAGNLKAVPDVSEYTGQGWITFDTIDGLVITGGGTIDGQGAQVWQYNDCKTNSDCVHLPASIRFNSVKDARIKGIKFLNAMGFHMHITNSYLVRIHRLSITAPIDSPNTDGMHISKSQAVKISRSIIRTGDDCVSVGQGAVNVTINQVTCGPGHGISIGSLGKYDNELDVRGLIIKNCTLLGTTNGLRIKTYEQSDPSVAAGLLFKDIRMEDVRNPIVIDQHYGGSSGKGSLVKIKDVLFQNIYGTSVSHEAVTLQCSSVSPCENVRFAKVNLKHVGTLPLISTCENAKVQSIGIQIPPICN